jgi:2-polyprenyl-3-methyl-5-hydroxy-6-metoxy-1,4-benzoquinol methylase
LVQTVADVCARPIAELRVLDLACHEGLNALEFGAQGAEVLGIEVREASVVKADFAKRALGLENVEFVRDDVRNLRAEQHGRFDVVLCLGILYHLDTPGLFELLARISEVCAHVAFIDTNVSVAGD